MKTLTGGGISPGKGPVAGYFCEGGNFELSETCSPRQGRAHHPGVEVCGPGVPDDAAIARSSLGGSSGDQHVPAVAVGVRHDERVAPGLFVPEVKSGGLCEGVATRTGSN